MIRRLAILALLLALLQPSDPGLRATWASTTAARIEWVQQEGVGITCLSRNSTLIRCWRDLPAGHVIVLLGGPLTDGAMRPERGAVYALWQDGEISTTPLRGVVYIPLAQ